MSSVYVFTGTHGTGKTTLAKTIAEKMKIPFYSSPAGEIHKKFGVNASDQIDFSLRVQIQHAIVNSWMDDYQAALKTGGVFDRGPTDFAAYLLGDVDRSVGERDSELCMNYVSHCVELANGIENLFLVHPHNATMSDRGADKPDTKNEIYALQIHWLIMQTLVASGNEFGTIPAGTNDYRISIFSRFMQDKFARKAAALKQQRDEEYEGHGSYAN